MSNWVNVAQDKSTGIELIHAHFKGFAYDPHLHSSYLIGVTELGHQQFNCRKKIVDSYQGQAFMLEPEEVHDGNAPDPLGFTYKMMHLDPAWLKKSYEGLFEESIELSIESTLRSDPQLSHLILSTYNVLSNDESQLMKDTYLDLLLENLVNKKILYKREKSIHTLPNIALELKEILHESLFHDLDLQTLSTLVKTDRFYINRVFKKNFNCSPHQYLIQLRLNKAKELLRKGLSATTVASYLCFSDQSHLGRWFKRCYGITLNQYQKACTNVLDIP